MALRRGKLPLRPDAGKAQNRNRPLPFSEVRTRHEAVGRSTEDRQTEQAALEAACKQQALNAEQVRRLTSENTHLRNKLAAARENARLADRRIAVLKAEYATEAP